MKNKYRKAQKLLTCPLCKAALILAEKYYCCPQQMHGKMAHKSFVRGQLTEILSTEDAARDYLRDYNARTVLPILSGEEG